MDLLGVLSRWNTCHKSAYVAGKKQLWEWFNALAGSF